MTTNVDPAAIKAILAIERIRVCSCAEAAPLVDALFVDVVDEMLGEIEVEVVVGIADVAVEGILAIEASAALSACETGGKMNNVEPVGGAKEK
jgi:hypothetical protein